MNMKWMPLVLAIGLTISLLLGCSGEEATPTPQQSEAPKAKQYSQPPPMIIDSEAQLSKQAGQGDRIEYVARINTSLGTIKVRLLAQEAPLAVNNFVFLAREGFYDNTPFHRIIEGFMIQGGDPTGTGSGGPGYTFDDDPVTRNYSRGTLAMANSGPNTNGSQFFIMHKGKFDMPKEYTIFGIALEGMKVVDAIAETPVTESPTGELSKPVENVIITSIEVKENTFFGSRSSPESAN